MLRGIVQQVREQPDEARAVGLQNRQAGRHVRFERDAGALDGARALSGHVTDELAERHRPEAQRRRGLLEDRELEQVGDEVRRALGLPAGVGERLPGVVRAPFRGKPLGLLEARGERRERRPQVVADVGDEVAAEAIGRAEAAHRRLDARGHVVDA